MPRHLDGQLRQAAGETFATAIALGGTLTGEHGIGLAKRDYLAQALDPVARQQMLSIKRLFDPNNILNPGKLFAETERWTQACTECSLRSRRRLGSVGTSRMSRVCGCVRRFG